MTWIFATIDKTGRLIHLSQKQWLHAQKHTDITVLALERIKETLAQPYKILPSENDDQVYYYYRYYKDYKQYLFISVKYLNGEGFVITSFYTETLQ